MSDVTRILGSIQRGDAKAADELLPLVYEELRRLAAHKMASETPGQTLQPTALVHEAWLRLGGDEQPDWKNRSHFFIAASEAMRRILVERARRKQRVCHGGGLQRVDVESVRIPAASRDDQLLALDEVLELFAREEPEKARVVKLRYFVGLSHQQTADVLGLSLATVERYWAFAKAWLYDRMRAPD